MPTSLDVQPPMGTKSRTGTRQRLKDIEDALAGRPIESEKHPSQYEHPPVPMLLDSQPPKTNKPRVGIEQRLKDIQHALTQKPVNSEGLEKENIPQETSLRLEKSLTGRELRLKLIRDALAEREVTSDKTLTDISNISSSKRPSPEQPSPVKRRRLESPCKAVTKVPPEPSPTPESAHISLTTKADSAPSSTNTIKIGPEKLLDTNHGRADPQPQLQCTEKNYVNKFFAQYPMFPYNPLASPMTEFDRLSNFFRWDEFKRDVARELLENAMSHGLYGKDVPRPKRRRPENYLDQFFARYPRFPYNPSAQVMKEFDRLSNFLGWEKPEKETARQELRDAMALQFNSMYGEDVEDASSWESLCRVMDIFPIPEGLEECRNTVISSYVNIVDLVEQRKTGGKVRTFNSEQDLSVYTKKNRKVFPIRSAYAGGVLRYLLRHILDPRSPRDLSHST